MENVNTAHSSGAAQGGAQVDAGAVVFLGLRQRDRPVGVKGCILDSDFDASPPGSIASGQTVAFCTQEIGGAHKPRTACS